MNVTFQRFEIFQRKAKGHEIPVHVTQCKDDAHCFTDQRSPGGAGSCHMIVADEDVIKGNIEEPCDGDEYHRRFRIACASKDAGEHIIDDDKGNTCKADVEIFRSFFPCFQRSLKDSENGGNRENKNEGKNKRSREK